MVSAERVVPITTLLPVKSLCNLEIVDPVDATAESVPSFTLGCVDSLSPLVNASPLIALCIMSEAQNGQHQRTPALLQKDTYWNTGNARFFSDSTAGTEGTANDCYGQQAEGPPKHRASSCSDSACNCTSTTGRQCDDHCSSCQSDRSSPSGSLDGSDATTDGGTLGPSTAVPPTDDILTTFSLFNIRGLKPQTTPSKLTAISNLLSESTQLFMALSET